MRTCLCRKLRAFSVILGGRPAHARTGFKYTAHGFVIYRFGYGDKDRRPNRNNARLGCEPLTIKKQIQNNPPVALTKPPLGKSKKGL